MTKESIKGLIIACVLWFIMLSFFIILEVDIIKGANFSNNPNASNYLFFFIIVDIIAFFVLLRKYKRL